MTTGTISGTCECGADVPRPRDEPSSFAHRVDARPFVCAASSDAQERERAAADAAELDEQQRREHAARVRTSSVPASLLRLQIEDLDVDAGRCAPIVSKRRWVIGEIAGLALIGPYGVGKTQIAGAAAARLASVRNLHWYRASDLVDHLSCGFSTDERARAQRAIDRTAPLILDDLDKTRPSEYAQAYLGHSDLAMTRRYMHYAPAADEAARIGAAFAVGDPRDQSPHATHWDSAVPSDGALSDC